jgi:hypothetical protein
MRAHEECRTCIDKQGNAKGLTHTQYPVTIEWHELFFLAIQDVLPQARHMYLYPLQ